jgi:hypothetical protein
MESGENHIRFSCKRDVSSSEMDVDLAFYNVDWYTEITASTNDANVCFEENNGSGQTIPVPARRNLITNDFIALGTQYGSTCLEGEDYCGDTGDFTVDFNDRGMDSNQSDGTDWGEDDSSKKCGTTAGSTGA